MCLEQMTHAWAYEEYGTTAATSEMFSKLGQSYTPGILNGILSKLDPSIREHNVSSPKYINTESESLASPNSQRRTILSILYLVVGRLPYFLRRRIFQIHNHLQVKLRNSRKKIWTKLGAIWKTRFLFSDQIVEQPQNQTKKALRDLLNLLVEKHQKAASRVSMFF